MSENTWEAVRKLATSSASNDATTIDALLKMHASKSQR